MPQYYRRPRKPRQSYWDRIDNWCLPRLFKPLFRIHPVWRVLLWLAILAIIFLVVPRVMWELIAGEADRQLEESLKQMK